MTGIRDSAARAAKRMRHRAPALELIWAGCWTLVLVGLLFVAAFAFCIHGLSPSEAITSFEMEVLRSPPGGFWVIPALLVLIPWVSAAIPWRWERVGGGVLVVEGVLLVTPVVLAQLLGDGLGVRLLTGTPPLAAGCLFLASWWRSRRSGIPQNSA